MDSPGQTRAGILAFSLLNLIINLYFQNAMPIFFRYISINQSYIFIILIILFILTVTLIVFAEIGKNMEIVEQKEVRFFYLVLLFGMSMFSYLGWYCYDLNQKGILFGSKAHEHVWDGYFFWFFIFYIIAPAVYLTALIALYKLIAVGMVGWRTKHPAAQLIDSTLKQRNPDDQLLDELARIMEAEHLDGDRAIEIISKMSPIKQFQWNVQHKVKLREAKRLQEAIKAKTELDKADTTIAWDALKMERTRRTRAALEEELKQLRYR